MVMDNNWCSKFKGRGDIKDHFVFDMKRPK